VLVFIDDAGDPGFKFARGSSRFFVVAYVVFDDRTDAEDACRRMQERAQPNRRAVNQHNRKIAGFDYADSAGNDLIQLADMVAGAIYRSYQIDKTDCATYRSVLRPRIDDVWDFG
jgi:hypothetical protein